MLTIGPLNELARVRHAFFGRRGGISDGHFASLNCGHGSGDDRDKVTRNRSRAMARFDLDDGKLVTAYQVHSDRVAVVTEPWEPGAAPQVDGLVTKQPRIALGVLTADCAPVLLADGKNGVIGAAHAGWRGALGGILQAVVDAMVELGAQREEIVAGIGPTIGQRSYEVGPEFPAPFLEQAESNGDFFYPAPRDGHFMFDLKTYVARRLGHAAVRKVHILPCDTCAEEDRFFSYRRTCLRGEKDYGRGLSAIYLED
jgi:hypothetical protein